MQETAAGLKAAEDFTVPALGCLLAVSHCVASERYLHHPDPSPLTPPTPLRVE